jgi:hypothetical protein
MIMGVMKQMYQEYGELKSKIVGIKKRKVKTENGKRYKVFPLYKKELHQET